MSASATASIVVLPVGADTLDQVAALLYQRNRTEPAYAAWKYAGASAGGVVATSAGAAVGCFGLGLRPLSISGVERRCGWFADWYVRPEVRGLGVGTVMLRALDEQAELIFGHPGPKSAQKLCRQHGYVPLAFQVRRRIVLDRWGLERRRTHYLAKAMGRYAWSAAVELRERARARPTAGVEVAETTVAFVDPQSHGRWVGAQPVASHVRRHTARWEDGRLTVEYLDDDTEHGWMHRRILFVGGAHLADERSWAAFFEDARRAGRLFVDAFTTDPRLDAVWGRFGGYAVSEPPVLVKGAPRTPFQVTLHGWDRENWTYAASRRDDDHSPSICLEAAHDGRA